MHVCSVMVQVCACVLCDGTSVCMGVVWVLVCTCCTDGTNVYICVVGGV